jgi:hypothetical protein
MLTRLLFTQCQGGIQFSRSIKGSLRCLSTSNCLKTSDNNDNNISKGFLGKFWGPQTSIANKDFTNRWSMFVPAFATHICLGAPYGMNY